MKRYIRLLIWSMIVFLQNRCGVKFKRYYGKPTFKRFVVDEKLREQLLNGAWD